MPLLSARFICGVLLTFAAVTVAHAQRPERVLMLHSFGPQFGDLYARDLRVQLDKQIAGRLELYESWVVSARFIDPQEDAAFAGYLSTLFADRPPDLIITLGAPAANFVQRHHQPLFSNTPQLLTDVEERRAAESGLTPNATVVAISVDFPAVVRNILRVLPRTNSVAVVIGNSPIEKFWVEEIRKSLEPFKDRVALTFLNELPFKEVLLRASTLPPNSAIFYVLLSPEVEGIPQDEDTALSQLHAVANAPMFSYADAYLGKGIVGGPLISGEEQGRRAISVAARLLSGEPASQIKTAPVGFGLPVFDWRELRRWNIRESDLPPGSTIRFREPTVWERYRWVILAVLAVLALQSALIARLLHERRRRRSAEMEAHQRMAELAHMNRRSTVGELSTAIAHQLTQPLAAILANAETAHLILHSPAPDLNELREIVVDITRDEQRAVEVIRRLRGLLARAPSETLDVDLNEVVREVFEFLTAQAAARRVTLSTSLAPRPLCVTGDRIQLQQVILNLIINAMDAVAGAAGTERKIAARTAYVDPGLAEVTIEDSGPGIPSDTAELIFEPFFTTKDTGMGMGLPIARTIVTNHGGRIWAENRSDGGAVFRFILPLTNARLSGVPLQSRTVAREPAVTG